MNYDAHVFEQDRVRVIHFVKDSDEEAIAWADLQWEKGVWTDTGTRLEIRRPTGDVVHLRTRNA